MKKFTSLMLLLLCAVTTTFAQLEVGKVYQLKSGRDAAKAMNMTATETRTATLSSTDYSQFFAVEAGTVDGTYALRNINYGKYIKPYQGERTTWSVSAEKTAETNLYMSVENEETGAVSLRYSEARGDGNNNAAHHESDFGGIVSWASSADASQWTPVLIGTVDEVNTRIANELAAFNPTVATATETLSNAGITVIDLQVADENAAGYVWANTYAADEEGVIAYLVDGKSNTYFHTAWSGYATDGTKDYIEVDLGENNSIKNLIFDYITRHDASTDYPTSVTILGSNTKGEGYAEIGTISEGLPTGNTKTYVSPVLTNGNSYRYIRFQVNSTTRGDATIPYFHLAEINFYSVADDFQNDYLTELTAINRVAKAADLSTPNNVLTATAAVNDAVGIYTWAAYPNQFSEFKANKCYTVTTKQRGGWAVNADGQFVSTGQAGDIAEEYTHFAILSDNGEDYYLFNVGANAFVKYDCTTVQKPGTSIAMVDASQQGYSRVRVNFNAENAYINLNGESNMEVCYWSEIDEGNAVLFEEAGDFDATNALQMLLVLTDEDKATAKAEADAIPTGVGYPTEAARTAYKTAVDAAETAVELETLKETFLADVSNYEMPAADKVYALDSYQDYLFNEIDGTTTIKTSCTGTDLNTKAYWKFIPVGSGENAGYKIQNVHTGLYMNQSQMSENPGLFKLAVQTTEDGSTKQAVMGRLYIKIESTNNCLHSANGNKTVSSHHGGGEGNQYNFVEVNEFSHTLNVTAAEWATIVLGFDAEIPTTDGFKAYTIASEEDGYVTLADATGVLKANVPVLVNAPEGAYEFAYTTEAATVESSGLSGTLYNNSVSAEAYVLGIPEGETEAGFAKALLTDGAFLNNANKAYFVPTSGQANVASYSFRFEGDTTGIEEVKGENGNVKTIYDLTGRRVESITAPGIYIVGGVKRVIR